MGLLEHELATLIEQIKQTACAIERAALAESKQRLCNLMAVLG